ncbi:hypothetical protein P3S67_007982 [Capsicum chacoense]
MKQGLEFCTLNRSHPGAFCAVGRTAERSVDKIGTLMNLPCPQDAPQVGTVLSQLLPDGFPSFPGRLFVLFSEQADSSSLSLRRWMNDNVVHGIKVGMSTIMSSICNHRDSEYVHDDSSRIEFCSMFYGFKSYCFVA